MQRLMESYCSKHHFRHDKVKLKYFDKKSGTAKEVLSDQTPSDLGMSLEHEVYPPSRTLSPYLCSLYLYPLSPSLPPCRR